MRVEAYFNLHSGLWSVRALEGEHRGRVIAHAPELSLSDVEFKVSEAGRQRVIREQRKNVHAFARGTLVQITDAHWRYPVADSGLLDGVLTRRRTYQTFGHLVSYNPYRAGYFYLKETGAPVLLAGMAYLNADRTVRTLCPHVIETEEHAA